MFTSPTLASEVPKWNLSQAGPRAADLLKSREESARTDFGGRGQAAWPGQRLSSLQASLPRWAGAHPAPGETRRLCFGFPRPSTRAPETGPAVSSCSDPANPLARPFTMHALRGPNYVQLTHQVPLATAPGAENRPPGPPASCGVWVCREENSGVCSGPAAPPGLSLRGAVLLSLCPPELSCRFTLKFPPTWSSAVLTALDFRHQGRFQRNG